MTILRIIAVVVVLSLFGVGGYMLFPSLFGASKPIVNENNATSSQIPVVTTGTTEETAREIPAPKPQEAVLLVDTPDIPKTTATPPPITTPKEPPPPQVITPSQVIKPRVTTIVDCGYPSRTRGWYDVQNQGVKNDFCRWVGDPPNEWFSCYKAGSTVTHTPKSEVYDENAPHDALVDFATYGCPDPTPPPPAVAPPPAVVAPPPPATPPPVLITRPAPGTVINDIQRGWRLCSKCAALVFENNAGDCPKGGSHEYHPARYYGVPYKVRVPNGQAGWRFCNRCARLCWGKFLTGCGSSQGKHDFTGSAVYSMYMNYPPPLVSSKDYQINWRFCNWCGVLFYGGTPLAPRGVCSGTNGGLHGLSGSAAYFVRTFS
jgi:hypothetical protein